jgi:hypothetical protein
MQMNPKHSSKSVEHFTPPEVIEAARSVLGGIDLDPASTALANSKLVKATQFFTAKENGYTKPWHGRIFLNPPGGWCDDYGRTVERGRNSSSKAWWAKLSTEYMSQRVSAAIFIGFSLEILQVAQEYKHLEAAISPPSDFVLCFPSKRIRFYEQHGRKFLESRSPTHANVIVYLPPEARSDEEEAENYRRFKRNFNRFGAIMAPGSMVR